MCRRNGSNQVPRLQAYGWGSARSFEIAKSLNERCLQWLACAATTEAAPGLDVFRRNLDLWRMLDSRACTRAARIPVVLLDCNFTRADWWTSVVGRGVRPVRSSDSQKCIIAGDAGLVLREILIEARTIAVAEPRAAHLIFGAPSIGVRLLASMSLADIDRIAAEYSVELRPRWAERTIFWRNLLLAAIGDTDDAMSELYCHSLQLLGADMLTSIAVCENGPVEYSRRGSSRQQILSQ
jgi:hypothetical protein